MKKIWLLFEVIWASVVGTALLKLKYPRKNHIVICHNDFMTGDIHINHGLHKALLIKEGALKMIIRNPIHLFLYLRETARHSLSIHRHIICFSNQQKNEFQRYFPKQSAKVSIIPNGIDLKRFNRSAPLPNDIDKPDVTKFLIFVGYEFDRKGLPLAIESLNFLPKHWKLLVVGGDTRQIKIAQEQCIAQSIQNRVIFTGTRYDVESLYRLSDCFVLPAKFEPWGLVAIEAIACGTPVVMTKVGSSEDFIKENINGYFCERNANDIAQKVIESANLNPALIAKTAEQYDWINIAKKYEEIIHND